MDLPTSLISGKNIQANIIDFLILASNLYSLLSTLTKHKVSMDSGKLRFTITLQLTV